VSASACRDAGVAATAGGATDGTSPSSSRAGAGGASCASAAGASVENSSMPWSRSGSLRSWRRGRRRGAFEGAARRCVVCCSPADNVRAARQRARSRDDCDLKRDSSSICRP
jgi:hypothetical protein